MRAGDMWVECFMCDRRFDGADAPRLVDEALAHIRQAHDLPNPDEEVRIWARNFAEASVRADGPTLRVPAIGSIEVHAVTESRIDDWIQFFDRDAFSDNPSWGSCYCLHPHAGEVPERPWRDVRGEMIQRLRSGATLGYLAYVDGRPAGWVNASRRSSYGKYRDVDPDGPAPDSVIGVSCFVIAPPYRRHGLSKALLDRVVSDAAHRGARFIEGYPRADGDGDAVSFCGPRSLFDARGFTTARSLGRHDLVRRHVLPE